MKPPKANSLVSSLILLVATLVLLIILDSANLQVVRAQGLLKTIKTYSQVSLNSLIRYKYSPQNSNDSIPVPSPLILDVQNLLDKNLVLQNNYISTVSKSAVINSIDDNTLLFPGLTWNKGELFENKIVIPGYDSLINLGGMKYIADPFVSSKTIQQDLLNFYSEENLINLGWKNMGYVDGYKAIKMLYYSESSRRYLEFDTYECQTAQSNDLTSSGIDICALVWISFVDDVHIPTFQEISQLQNLEFGTMAYSNPLPVPFYSQRNSDPNKNIILGYGTCTGSIYNYGCTLTAHTMIYNYFQPGYTSVVDLNNKMKVAPGVFSLYQNGCYNLWPTSAPDAPSGVSYGQRKLNNCWDSNCIDSGNVTIIDDQLRAGKPMHLRVHVGYGGLPSHSVVLIGHVGNDYIIKDPWATSDENLTLSNGALGAYVVDSIDTYNGTPPDGGGSTCDATSLPSGYTKCADEGGTCNFSGSTSVFYGASNCYRVKTFSNGVTCNNDNFSPDPVSGVTKACYINNPSTTCPTVSGEVRLYDLTNCGGEYTSANSTGLWSVANAFNDRAESIAIPSGWSTRLYQNDNENSNESICINGTDTNLNDNVFANGGNVGNNTTWLRVFNQSSCPISVPTTPSNPNPNNITLARTNNTTLTWSTNGTSCTVHVWGGSIDISPSGSCTNLALGAQRGGAYTWQVTASNSSGSSTGPAWYFNIRPYAPTGLNAAVASSSQINLSWTKSSDDDGTNIDGYDIYRNSQLVGSVNKGVSTYQATGLVCNTSYSFYIVSKRQNVLSDSSGVVSAITSACGPASPTLNSPANNATLARTDNVVLSWNTASGATQYRVHFWGGPSIDSYTGWVSGTSASLGTQWGGAYQWSVEASNGSASSFSVTRTLTILYGTPSNLSATPVSASQVDLSWSPSADAPGNIQGYRIYRNGSAITTVGSSTTTYNDTSLTCGTNYSYTIKAYNGSLESSASNSVNTTTSGCTPAMPSDLIISEATASSLTLSWQDNSNNESGFKIYRWGYDGTEWTFIFYAAVGPNVTAYTQTGLTCGSDFNYYEVSAYNNIGESSHAGWIQGTTSGCSSSNLTITNLYFPASVNTNDDIHIFAEVANLTVVDAGNFWIDFYVDDQPVGCTDYGQYWTKVSGLVGNTNGFWSVTIPAGTLPVGMHTIRAFVDSGCEVSETNEDDNNAGPLSITVSVPPVAAPWHDDFDAANLISAIPYSDSVDVRGATRAGDDPAVAGCNLAPGSASVWYKYTSSVNKTINLDTFGSDYDTYLAVWTGTRGSLTEVACNDDYDNAGGILQSHLKIDLIGGTTYYIEIAQYSWGVLPASEITGVGTVERSLTNAAVTPSGENIKSLSEVSIQAGGSLIFHSSSSSSSSLYNIYLPLTTKP